MVVDLTTAFTTQERSRLPVDPDHRLRGHHDQPQRHGLPTTLYSSPSSFGMSSTFYHFWLAERTDLYDPIIQNNVLYRLPMIASPSSNYPTNPNDAYGSTRQLKGESALVTLNTRTGRCSPTRSRIRPSTERPRASTVASTVRSCFPSRGSGGIRDEDSNRRQAAADGASRSPRS